jgi:transposase
VSGDRKKYTREQAVRLVVDTGRPIAHVAAEIDVGDQLRGRWVAAAKARSATDDPDRGTQYTSGHFRIVRLNFH